MNNIIEKEDQDTAKAVRHSRLGKFWKPLASAAIAAVAAVSMGMSAGAATAAPTVISGYHHVDYVSVNYTRSTGLEMGSNLNDTGWVSPGTYSIKVPWSSPATTSDTEGTGYILPELQADAIARNVPWVGFSGDNNLYGILAANDTVAVTMQPISAPANATVSQTGQTWYTQAGGTHTFSVVSGTDEAFHQHPKWVFSKAGTYKFNFSAKATNSKGTTYSAGAQEYDFIVG